MASFYNCPKRSRKSNVFLATISRKASAHRFSPPGYPGDMKAAFSPKTTLFRPPKGGDNMAVFRIEKTRDYTVMSNHHLRNAGLSLKSKGLLSMMLSLPENWNYTTRGLAKICKEGTDSIGSAPKELERAGYIVRNRLRDNKGKIVDVEYVIYETPHPPDTGQPC